MVVIYSQNRRKGSNSLLESELLELLKKDYPQFRFVNGAKYAFRPPRTIVIGPDAINTDMLLLHELSHALCGHKTYGTDVQRLKMEAEAWAKAEELAAKYSVSFDEEAKEVEMDTYRDWLHQKSRCPVCGLTRFQTPDRIYHCPRCESFT